MAPEWRASIVTIDSATQQVRRSLDVAGLTDVGVHAGVLQHVRGRGELVVSVTALPKSNFGFLAALLPSAFFSAATWACLVLR